LRSKDGKVAPRVGTYDDVSAHPPMCMGCDNINGQSGNVKRGGSAHLRAVLRAGFEAIWLVGLVLRSRKEAMGEPTVAATADGCC
jgi:hypothetical protein